MLNMNRGRRRAGISPVTGTRRRIERRNCNGARRGLVGAGLIALLLFLGSLVIHATVPMVQAAPTWLEPADWADPKLWLQDRDDTPGFTAAVDPWYDDTAGRLKPKDPQPQRETELLYVGITWDDTYLYVRWDVAAPPEAITQVYYLLAFAAGNETATPTHALQWEVDNKGSVTVTIRDAATPRTVLWTGAATDHRLTSMTPTDPAVATQTACEGRYPWAHLTGDGPQDLWVVTAESHTSNPAKGPTSDAHDSIEVGALHAPWFTDLGLTLAGATLLIAVQKRKQRIRAQH